jgi:N-methylhydantoinase A/oxoprolinase/acetone carboxylase beta subunit
MCYHKPKFRFVIERCCMSIIIGIDTGGTYTDGVLLDSEDKNVVAKTKTLTTKQDLTICIRDCLQRLSPGNYGSIDMVCLSTTLATNAIVEGLGCNTGLILIGGIPEGKLPIERYVVIQGLNDIKGCVVDNLDKDEIKRTVESFRGKTEALVISGYASVRNPSHELYVKTIAREVLDIPVVCAHELTSTLGFYDRTVTAVLNARLIPIIKDLIDSVKAVLLEMNIAAPIMIVKGDGSLMKEEFASDKPIETILSGPAASIVGGIGLSGENDAIVIDIGGTTTDIAIVKNGKVETVKDGALVGGWLTRVNAAEISTFGLGGDSLIHINRNGRIEIGPHKVWPLCLIGSKYPYLANEISEAYQRWKGTMTSGDDTDCYMLFRQNKDNLLEDMDAQLLTLLGNGPHSIFYLAESLGKEPDTLDMQRLIDMELVSRISVTPTDVLHVQDRYQQWDKKASLAALNILADKMNLSLEDLIDAINRQMTGELSSAIIRSIVFHERKKLKRESISADNYLLNQAAGLGWDESILKFCASTNVPVVAIGAPVQAWMGDVAKQIGATLIIPEHAEVANAIGAAIGQVKGTIETLIRPDANKEHFVFYAQWERRVFDELDKAKEYALTMTKEYAENLAYDAGGTEIEAIAKQEDIYVDDFLTKTKTFIETRTRATAVGKPACCC